MEPKIKLPSSFNAPTGVEHPFFYLEPLAPQHNKLDFEAWNSSIDNLVGVFGPDSKWPKSVQGKKHNLRDLEKHYAEFKNRDAFAYTILSPDKLICIGCLYIDPSSNLHFECRVDFWFRDSHLELEGSFLLFLDFWLRNTWKLGNVAYPGRKVSWEKYLNP